MEYRLTELDLRHRDSLTPYDHADDGWEATGGGLYSRGWWIIDHTRASHTESYLCKNLITTVGKAAEAGLVNGVVTTPFKAVGFGTGTTIPAAGDTALVAEKDAAGGVTTTHVCSTTAGTYSRVTTTTTNDTAQILTQVIAITATMALSETGVFDANIAGTLLCRAASGGGSPAFPVINVISGDTVQLTWKVQML